MTDKQWVENFKKALQEQLGKNNMTQSKLAEISGITEVSISRYVNGNRIPKAPEIVALTKSLNCKCDDLCLFDRNEMIKGIIEIDVPESCKVCKFRKFGFVDSCLVCGKTITGIEPYEMRPKWCPIKERREYD